MNEQQTMLSEMADGLFAELGSGATVADDWKRIEEVGLASLLVSEGGGGFGGTWEDALIVFRLAGYHAVPLPLVETAIAAGLSGGIEGRGTIAAHSAGELTGDRFIGTVTGVVAGEGAAYVVAPAPDNGAMLLTAHGAQVEPGANIAGEQRAAWRFTDATVVRIDADVFALGALARAAQIAGGLDAALAKSVAYANERQQFGRALAKFQVVQQGLASFACEAAAANCAAMGAAQAMTRGLGDYEIAAAKLRANRAVGVGTAIAHQIHGAIGFTQEYDLHPLTRRLWAWRSEFGNDSYWADVLGTQICAAGAGRFWVDLTARTD